MVARAWTTVTPSVSEESGTEGIRERLSGRSEGTLGELAELLLDNPLIHQALQVAVEARDRATQASATAMRGLNVSQASEVDRLERRLRAVSERLEALEDEVDLLRTELRGQGKGSTPPPGLP
jgi:hypothetical protein